MTDNPNLDHIGTGSALDREVARLCRTCVDSVGVDGGGVAIIGAGGHRGTVYATDDVAACIEDSQFLLGEGPCVDAATRRSPVLVEDINDRREGVQGRWPGFLETATRAGVRAIFAFPLRIGAISLGAMDLYRTTPGPMSRPQVRAALLAADATALAVLDAARGAPLDGGRGWQGVAARAVVHNAAGMVTVQAGVSIEDALVRLRATAYALGRSIDDVAEDIAHGRLRLAEEDA